MKPYGCTSRPLAKSKNRKKGKWKTTYATLRRPRHKAERLRAKLEIKLNLNEEGYVNI